MSTTPILAVLALSGLAAALYLGLATQPASILRSAVKTASVAGLALLSGLAGLPVALTAALGFCALGDALLSRETDRSFMAGVAAFAVGHLAYIALFLSDPASDASNILAGPNLALAVALILLGAAMARLLAARSGALRPAVLAYVPVILGMAIAALTLPGLTDPVPRQGYGLAIAGALLFVSSDLALALGRFALPARHRVQPALALYVWSSYWVAQALLLHAWLLRPI